MNNARFSPDLREKRAFELTLSGEKTFSRYVDQLFFIRAPDFLKFANPALDMPGVRVGLRAF